MTATVEREDPGRLGFMLSVVADEALDFSDSEDLELADGNSEGSTRSRRILMRVGTASALSSDGIGDSSESGGSHAGRVIFTIATPFIWAVQCA